MGYATCQRCKGSGRFYDQKSGKTFDCRACNGKGSDTSRYEDKCHSCGAPVIYPVNASNPPRFCRECGSREHTKTCAQSGCYNTIKYKASWSSIPDYCGRCSKKRQEGWTASTCPGTNWMGCGKVIWSPPGKRFETCPDCSARKRADDQSHKHTKRCPGLQGQSCGNEITYDDRWERIPDICPSCREKAKEAKKQREANMREKPCAGGCGRTIKYSLDWEHPPNFCPECKQRRQTRHEPNQSENPRFYAACGRKGANLSEEETHRFSEYFHGLPDRQRMSFDEIATLAKDWKENHGGGFRRSDRR